MFGKEKLVFDPAAASETDNVGAYLRASDGTLLTHTDVGGKKALDVNVENDVTVIATDLDIRDLDFATDSVDVSGSAVSITGDVNVTQGTSPWVVSATDLDIRDLAFATDSVTAHQGGTWIIDSITNDVNVTATDLDIRDLDAAQDNVAISDGTNTLVVNADGSINVNADIDIVTGSEKAEDAAHASGDIGNYVLAVRQDTLANSVSADGDYASFKVNAQGALYVDVSKAAPASHTSWLVSQNTVSTTAELIVAADLANRKKILIQNVTTGGKTLYLGHSNAVTTANGIRLSSGAGIELELAAGVEIWAIANDASADVRVAELAA
jgi:hypothetical protein